MTKNQFLAIGGGFFRYKIFFLTKSSLIRPLNTVGVVSMIVFDFCILSPGPNIKPPTKGISWEEKHRGEMNFTTKKILEKQKSLQVKSRSPDKFLR